MTDKTDDLAKTLASRKAGRSLDLSEIMANMEAAARKTGVVVPPVDLPAPERPAEADAEGGRATARRPPGLEPVASPMKAVAHARKAEKDDGVRIRLGRDLRQRLRIRAAIDERSMQAIVELAVEEYLTKREKS